MTKKTAYLFMLLWLIVSYNSELRNTAMPVIGLGINIVLEGIILLSVAPYLFQKFDVYKKWVIAILLFWGLSVTWSVNPNSFEFYWKYGLIYLLTFSFSSVIRTKKDVEMAMNLNLIAVFLCGIYVLLFLNTGDLANERLGQDQGMESVWNANDIGLKMAIGYAICVYFMLKKNKGSFYLFPFILILLIVAFLSGSRKVLFLLILFSAFLMVARSKGAKKMLMFVSATILLIGSYWAVMNIPILYDIIGRRVELVADWLAGGDGGSSIKERSLMVFCGWEWFLDRPWLGYGINSFCVLFGRLTGWEVYAHNNFIELMVDTGIVGLLLYYSLTIYILIELWKPALRDKDLLALVLFIYTLLSTIMDYGMVSYVQEVTIFRLMYTAKYCQIVNERVFRPITNEASVCHQ